MHNRINYNFLNQPKWHFHVKSIPNYYPDSMYWETKARASMLSKYCQEGKILEAMCGSCTYIKDTESNRIVGLDCSRHALSQYPNWRDRIWCDLSQLYYKTPHIIEAFDDCEFTNIVECYGYKYPIGIVAVFKEFYRVLQKNGNLIMVENTNYGYADRRRSFFGTENDKKTLARQLTFVGFRDVEINQIGVWFPTEEKKNHGEYLITAKK